ncbi:MAG TPA: hypothetical protein VLH75_09955 [Longimicrobiales bacterium]|nr:hypothetical protein [Longimicrobiales bacterium]
MAGGDAPPSEMLAAVERASRHLGREGPTAGARPVILFDAPRLGHRRLWVLGGLLVLSMGAAALVPMLRPRAQPAADVEADLRWAVAHVVREVEAHRARSGALPGPEVLRPLLGEHVAYEAVGDSYLVTAKRDGIEVRFDGSVELEAWLAGEAGTSR